VSEVTKLLRIEDALVRNAERDLSAALNTYGTKNVAVAMAQVRLAERRAARSRVQRIVMVERVESQEET
jgi:acyl-CoA synthetase (NDP forming)